MSKQSGQYRVRKRRGKKGVSFTIEIWDSEQGGYALTQTFASWKYGTGKTGERFAERTAHAWGSENSARMLAGVIEGNRNGNRIDTAEMIKKYLNHLTDRGGNDVHIGNIKTRLKNLPKYLPTLDMKDAPKQAYMWWQDWCKEPGVYGYKPKGGEVVCDVPHPTRKVKSHTTCNNCLRNLKSFVNWCWKYRAVTGLLDAVDLDWIERLPEERKVKAQFTVDELRTGLELIDHPYVIRFALYTYLGLRTREALHLRYEDFIDGHVIVRKGKGAKQRIVVMQDGLQPFVDRHLAADNDYEGYLFPDNLRKSQSLVKSFNRFLEESHIIKGDRSTHSLRHCYAGMMTASGEPTALVQSYMGHSDSDMTMHYAQFAAFYRKDAESWGRGKIML